MVGVVKTSTKGTTNAQSRIDTATGILASWYTVTKSISDRHYLRRDSKLVYKLSRSI